MQTRKNLCDLGRLRQVTYFSKILETYYVKLIKYGIYTDVYDYKKVRALFRYNRGTYIKRTTGKKQAFSLSRAREKIYRIVEANTIREKKARKRTVFVTLTTADQISDYKESNKKIKAFIRRLNKYLGYKSKYIIVPELHKSGAIHYHAVFFNLPFIPVEKLRYEIWTFGYVDIQIPKNIKKIGAYLSKYLTKNFHKNTPLHTKLYFTSRGLSYPHTTFTDCIPQGKLTDSEVVLTPQYIKYTIYE